jgi:hypothetical protein
MQQLPEGVRHPGRHQSWKVLEQQDESKHEGHQEDTAPTGSGATPASCRLLLSFRLQGMLDGAPPIGG